jgi:hypothetical protein
MLIIFTVLPLKAKIMENVRIIVGDRRLRNSKMPAMSTKFNYGKKVIAFSNSAEVYKIL